MFIIYTISLGIAALISGWVAWYARHRRSSAGSYELTALMLLASTWSLALVGESLSSSYIAKVFWTVLSYPGNMMVPVMFFVFVLRYTQQDRWLKTRQVALLLLMPALSVMMAATNHWHHLLWPSITIEMIDGWAVGVYQHGPWFWMEIIYSYFFMALGIWALLRAIFRYPDLYSRQTRLILFASLAPLIGNIVYAFVPSILGGVDITPLAFTASGALVAWAIFRYNLFDVAPIARDRLVEIVQQGVLVFDVQNRLIDCNPAAQRLFGWDHPPLGLDVSSLGKDHPLLLTLCQAPETQSLEASIQTQGSTSTYSFYVSLLNNRDGQAAGRIILAYDVTDRRVAEAQMRLQAKALDAADNGIVITNDKGLVQWVNPAFTRLTGYTLAEIAGKSTRILKSGQQNDEYYRQMWNTIRNGQVWHGELVNRRNDGTLYFEEMIITPLVQPDGAITNYIAIKQDVSERKQAEEELLVAHDAALQANRMKTQLLANVSHDLRTPLGAIMGFADMLRSGLFGPVNEQQENAASEIIDSSNQLLVFVNNLIGQAQIETGKVVLKTRPFDPLDLLEAARSAASLIVKKKGLLLECELDPAVPANVPGDIYWLRQIVLNLVSNAVKFTDQGQVTVRIFVVDADYWGIRVADTGIGIPSEARATIFDAFRQVDGSATRKYGGSGLGLSIVKELVTLMDGRIYLESEMGKGSAFTVLLPLNVEEKNI